MSDEFSLNLTNAPDPTENGEQDFEEISSDEVDRVVEALESLAASTQSENIRCFLDEAANHIFDLIYDEDEESPADDDLPHEEAA